MEQKVVEDKQIKRKEKLTEKESCEERLESNTNNSFYKKYAQRREKKLYSVTGHQIRVAKVTGLIQGYVMQYLITLQPECFSYAENKVDGGKEKQLRKSQNEMKSVRSKKVLYKLGYNGP